MKKIGAFAISFFLTMAAAVAAWVSSFGYYQPAEHWIREIYIGKEAWAGSIKQPKILIVSGSNALFGMDSGLLSKMTGKPVANLAGHAGLPFQFLADKALANARPGDIVIMPLEYEYYRPSGTVTRWQVTNMETWGTDFLLWHPDRMARYFRFSKLYDVADRLATRQPLPIESRPVILSAVEANPTDGPTQWQGYSYKTMNRYGDFYSDAPVYPQEDSVNPLTVGQDSIAELTALSAKLQQKGARMWLTWPVTMKNRYYDLTDPKAIREVMAAKAMLAKAGLDVHCEPSLFQFEKKFFTNTASHLNVAGAELRTRALAECFNAWAGKPKQDVVATATRR